MNPMCYLIALIRRLPVYRAPMLMGLVLLLLQLWSLPLRAHEVRPAIVDIRQSEQGLSIEMLLNAEALMAEIGPEHSDTDESPNAVAYERLRALPADQLQQELESFIPTLLAQIQLVTGTDQGVTLQWLRTDVDENSDTRQARDTRLYLQGKLPDDASELRWQWDRNLGPLILRFGEAQADNAFSQYVQPGNSSDTIALDGVNSRSTLRTFLDYIVVGFEHIVPKGLDHILFVIGLFLLAPRFKPIFWQVSCFTLAHSITLAASMLGLITVSPAIVEPLIALSIVIIGVENLLTRQLSRFRPWLVFAFGLLHGLGFASVLREFGMADGDFATALIAFNIGVEVGQLSVILACFALVGWWFRDRSWYRQRVSIPGSLIIAAVGLFWFVQRVS